MKKQVVVVHGGNPFQPGMDFIDVLKEEEVDIDDFKRVSGWKENLQGDLGDDFEVLAPRMPNKDFSKYPEWKVWFEKMLPFVRDGVVLIGHSLGGIFLAKYLSENVFPKKIRALFLVAAPYDIGDTHSEAFLLGADLSKVTDQAAEIFIYHSKDDHIVPFADFAPYVKNFPQAHAVAFEDKGHFFMEHFPELVKAVQKL